VVARIRSEAVTGTSQSPPMSIVSMARDAGIISTEASSSSISPPAQVQNDNDGSFLSRGC
jgi:hypothetical protein